MNIFITDSDPILAAKILCNRHIVKMPSETVTMISSVFQQFKSNGKQIAYFNHPASIWCRKTKENLEWLILHGLAQCEEYSRRYKRRHASQDFIEWSSNNYQHVSFSESGITDFARCFSGFKQELDETEPNTLEAYRKFYWLDKKDFAKWPSRKEIPQWWPEISDNFVDKAFVNGVYSRR
jgi:hypothetical protein